MPVPPELHLSCASTSSTSLVYGILLCICFARSFFSQMMHWDNFARGTGFSFQPFNTHVLYSFLSLDQRNQPPGSIVIDRESEVYKMLQENQESNEPPRQSASFLVLQEILESEEKGEHLLHSQSQCDLPFCHSLVCVQCLTSKTLYSFLAVDCSMCRWSPQKQAHSLIP